METLKEMNKIQLLHYSTLHPRAPLIFPVSLGRDGKVSVLLSMSLEIFGAEAILYILHW